METEEVIFVSAMIAENFSKYRIYGKFEVAGMRHKETHFIARKSEDQSLLKKKEFLNISMKSN